MRRLGHLERIPLKSISVALAVVLLAGCSAGSDYSSTAAADLQQRVMNVSTSVSTGDYALAKTQLVDLTAAADSALQKGDVTKARHDSILAAAGLVQSDIDAAIAAAEAKAAAEAEKLRLAAEEAARRAEENKKGSGKGKNDG